MDWVFFGGPLCLDLVNTTRFPHRLDGTEF